MLKKVKQDYFVWGIVMPAESLVLLTVIVHVG